MSLLVANCPRCGAKEITFDVSNVIETHTRHSWQRFYEAFCICRRCKRSTVFILEQRYSKDQIFLDHHPPTAFSSVNDHFKSDNFICIRNLATQAPPEHVPANISTAFSEGATSIATGCWNAAATMFRLAIDLATRPLLPEGEEEGLTRKVRRDLGLRLPWLFKTGRLPAGLEDLSQAVREDGNDGAHQGTLIKEDAYDLADFTTALLERLYTEPEQIRLAQARRLARRSQSEEPGSG
jgi:hypothetical protein